jgi:hypothetical protein
MSKNKGLSAFCRAVLSRHGCLGEGGSALSLLKVIPRLDGKACVGIQQYSNFFPAGRFFAAPKEWNHGWHGWHGWKKRLFLSVPSVKSVVHFLGLRLCVFCVKALLNIRFCPVLKEKMKSKRWRQKYQNRAFPRMGGWPCKSGLTKKAGILM